ncbi:hypothetical protein [Polaribacter sp. Hel1_85]|uniref:hypothetical protein n=1 Tax=Polaribacter sp. Hel1_85 TaxID=1250005 RepID=UPI00052C283F|nr:hypothetical protein [Polaribacter sp. Hel1_85]KGL64024.1 hypothetical protein PHEL85_1066 [Polaribacter sp. Hel1_85]
MIKKLLELFLLFFTIISLSQEKQILISGKILDSIGIVKNANIINLKTNQGTFSFDDGSFSIFVHIGDSLQISSVQHITKKMKIRKETTAKNSLIIRLKSNTYVLDAFELKRHNLTGRLGIDIKNIPTDKKDSLLRNVMDFSNVDFKKKDFRIDENMKAKPPIVNTVPNSFSGAGASVSIPFKDKESILRKELNRKKAVPYKILSTLGKKFFFDELKIPKDNYFHFLDYCNPLGIEKLHQENKILELIKIFQKESVPYLKIIKKE